jgi:cystathionine beta-lyase
MDSLKKKTQCVHSGTIFDQRTRGVNTPIYTSTSYSYLDTDDLIYPRYFNTPNNQPITEKICALEGGDDALAFSSGMSAITTTLLTFLKKGDHAVFQHGLYGGTFHFITKKIGAFGINITIADSNKNEDIEKAIQPNTRIVYIETPSNPLLGITDIISVAQISRARNFISIIDNTFASPINQCPLHLGVDVVIHSATKYLGGHSDICAGMVVSSRDKIKQIYQLAINLGGSLDPITCYQMERSMKTLALRVEQQNNNAITIARFLEKHPRIGKVYYPGLESHNGYDIARKQMTGFGGMLSFEVEKMDPVRFQKKLNLIKPSMSLGGVDSIICAPFLTSHGKLSQEERLREGIKDSLLRLSVGIEDVSDLLEDLEQALSSSD